MTALDLDAAAREAPDALALEVGGERVTYAALLARAVAAGEPLRRDGHPGASPLRLVGASDLGTLITLHAAVRIGAPVVLLHPRLTSEERRELEEFLDGTPPGAVAAGDPRDPRAPLAVLFTSGSTSRPKAVVLGRGAFVASARASARNLPLAPGDRWLLGLPIAHVGGLSVLTRCLVARAAVVVPADTAAGARLDARGLAAALSASGATHVSLVPTQLDALLALEPPFAPPASLRAVLLGGAPARAALLDRAAARGLPVITTYGLTEACSQVTTSAADRPSRAAEGVGRPLPGTELRVVAGALQLRGPTLLTGYLEPGGLRDPRDPEGWFATTDLGRLDEQGRLHVEGRASELIVTGGENVSPLEVERVLEGYPGIEAACVFGVPDDRWGERVVAAVTGPLAARPAATDLTAWFTRDLAPHRRPRALAWLDALPATAAGKLDRAETARQATPLLTPL